MPSNKDFKPLWPGKDYACPSPDMGGDMGGTKGGSDVGGNSDKETSDRLGQKVTFVDVGSQGSVKKGDKVTPETFKEQIATTTARKPTKPAMK